MNGYVSVRIEGDNIIGFDPAGSPIVLGVTIQKYNHVSALANEALTEAEAIKAEGVAKGWYKPKLTLMSVTTLMKSIVMALIAVAI